MSRNATAASVSLRELRSHADTADRGGAEEHARRELRYESCGYGVIVERDLHGWTVVGQGAAAGFTR